MTHNWYSPQKDAETLDAKKLSFGIEARQFLPPLP